MAKTDFSKLNTTLQKAQERKKKFAEGGGQKTFTKIEWGKVPFGDTTLMVLPPKSEDVDFFHEVMVHHNYPDPETEGKKRSYLCAKAVHGSCPMCDFVDELKAKNDKRANDYRAQRTFLINGMDQDGNVKVYPLKPSQHTEVMQEINTAYIDDDQDITDPANGKLIKISRLKASPWARARVIGKKLEMAENKVSEVLAKCADLRKVYADISPEDFVRVLNGEEVVYKTKNEDSEELQETVEEVVEDSAIDTIKEIEAAEAKAAAAAKQRSDEEKIAAARAKAEANKPAGAKPIQPTGQVSAAAKVATSTPKTAETAKPAPAPKAEAKSAVVEAETSSTGDPELDAMLNDLDMK